MLLCCNLLYYDLSCSRQVIPIQFNSILFYSILFHSIPFHSALFRSVQFRSIPFYSTLLYSTLLLLYSTLPTLLYYTLLYSTLLYSTLFCSVPFIIHSEHSTIQPVIRLQVGQLPTAVTSCCSWNISILHKKKRSNEEFQRLWAGSLFGLIPS